MRPVHLLGLGMVVGMLALGTMLAVIGYRWQEATFPGEVAKADGPAPQGPGEASPQQVAQGQALFGQRCSGCHSIGEGDMAGPDLAGVANRRPYPWLEEIITDPQTLINRSDPIIMELVDRYPAVMPDTGTTPAEAASIIAFIASESPEPAPPPEVPAGQTPAEGGQTPAPAPAATPAQAPATPVAATSRQTLSFSQAAVVGAQAPPGGAQTNGDATSGEQLFQQMCASCHSIGEGRRVGPDLQGVTEQRPQDWLVEIIVDPGALHARGDPTALELQQEYGMQMPDLGVTEPQALDLLAYIAAQSAGAGPPATPAPEVELPPGNAETGQALFLGSQRFSGGGPACIACHDIEGAGYLQGGTWARDLSGAVDRLGPGGFAGILRAPPFPAMSVAYGNEAFADQEIADLVAFAGETQAGSGLPGGQLFPLMGFIAFVVMAGASHLIWRGRARSVREPGLTYKRY